MTDRLIILTAVFTICALILNAMWADIAAASEPDTVEFLDDNGLTVVRLPGGWRAGDVWDLVGEIEGLPEAQRV